MVTVRRAQAGDAPAILRCLATAFEPFRAQYTPEGFRDTTLTKETVQDRLRTMTLFVAVDSAGEVVGTVGGSVHSVAGHIRGMAVLPEWQGTGVAALLLRTIEDALRAQGCRRVTLDTTAPLERAIGFYERQGYRASGKVGDFFGMPLYEYVKEL
jgi:GNAT superfamily N-acetyltransferase